MNHYLALIKDLVAKQSRELYILFCSYIQYT